MQALETWLAPPAFHVLHQFWLPKFKSSHQIRFPLTVRSEFRSFRLFQLQFNYKRIHKPWVYLACFLLESLPAQAWHNFKSGAVLDFIITPYNHTPSVHPLIPRTKKTPFRIVELVPFQFVFTAELFLCHKLSNLSGCQDISLFCFVEKPFKYYCCTNNSWRSVLLRSHHWMMKTSQN